MDQVQNESCVQRNFRAFPERVILLRAFGRGVFDHIALLKKQRCHGPERFSLGVSHKKAAICLHQIRLHKKACFARTRASDYDLKEIAAVHFAVQAHADILRQDGVVARVFVPVLGVQPLGAAPLGGAVFFSRPAVLTGRVVKSDGSAIGHQRRQHEFNGMRCPSDRKRALQRSTETAHPCKEGHIILIGIGRYCRQPEDR